MVVCRYFTLFMNLLNDCSEVEDEGQAVGGRKRGMSRRLASLRHCTVLAMSNLLNANVDSGLMHSIGKSASPLPAAAFDNCSFTQRRYQQSSPVLPLQVWATTRTCRLEPPSWKF